MISPVIVSFGFIGAVGNYGFTDDYAGIWANIEGKINWDLSLSQGRPILVLFGMVRALTMDSIHSLFLLHIIDISALALFSYFLTRYFKNNGIKSFESSILSAAPIVLAPGIMLFAAWPSLGAGIPAFLFSIFSITSIDKRYWWITSTIFLVLAYLTYPPAANIFVLFSIILLLTKNTAGKEKFRQSIKEVFLHRVVIVYVLAGSASLFILKFIASLYPENVRTTLIGSFSSKFYFIRSQVFPRIIDPFDFSPGVSIFGKICFLIISFASIKWIISKNLLPKIAFILFGFILSIGPNILTAENWPSNRSLLGAQFFYLSVVTISLIEILKLFSKLQYYAYVAVIILGCYSTNKILVETIREPQLEELNMARKSLRNLDLNSTVYVKKSEWYDTLSPQISADEFGLPSSAQPWVFLPLTKILIREINQNQSPTVEVSVSGSESNLLDYHKLLSERQITRN